MSVNLKSTKRPSDVPAERSISIKRLQKILLSKPPIIEIVSKYEVYITNEDGSRGKRICGQKIGIRNSAFSLPDFVPDELNNPWNVTNPRMQYVCERSAGWKTDHVGVGFCRRHDQKRDSDAVKNPFIGVNKKSDKTYSPEEGSLLKAIGDFDSYLTEAKSKTAPDQLLDITRPLYELEALKLMTIEWMRQYGFNAEAVESIAKRIQEAANVQLILAKRDHEIIRNKAIAAMVRVFVTGFLSIIQTELLNDPAKAKNIAQRMNDELLMPVQNVGLTEILKRQESSGALNRVMELADAALIEDASFTEEESEDEF